MDTLRKTGKGEKGTPHTETGTYGSVRSLLYEYEAPKDPLEAGLAGLASR